MMLCEPQFVTLMDQFCPMYVLLDETGHIVQAGPTLKKLRPAAQMQGQRFMEVFELLRPRSVASMSDLMTVSGAKLHLQFRDVPRTALKGLIVPLDGGGAVLNLSFGISILDAVRDYDLNSIQNRYPKRQV